VAFLAKEKDDLLDFGALLHSARHPETYRAAFEDL